MSDIVIGTVPLHGHVTPLLNVARHLVERGDRVRFLTGSRFAEKVTAVGAQHVPLPPEADFDDRQDWDVVFPERRELSGIRALAFDIENTFVRPAQSQYQALQTLFAETPADAVLTDGAFAGGAYLLGGDPAQRPPVIACGVTPLFISSRDTAPGGMGLLPVTGPVGRLRNAALAQVARRLVLADAQRVADGIHREIHGTPLEFLVLDWPRHADAILQFTVPEFEYPRSDAPEHLHFVGPVSATGSRAPLPDWWSQLDGSRPVIHVTQGTFANRDYRQIITPTLEAFADDDVHIVVSTGGRRVDTLPELPANTFAAEYLPYDDLLPKTDVFVTNGGYGGVQYALRYGVPVVTSGGLEDKPEVGARIAWSGVGRRLKSEMPSAAAVREAVRHVLDDSSYAQAAERMATAMADSAGLQKCVEVVDRLIGTNRP
ncbi:glycosyltransferase [Gordonia sp. VNQ95]|uniref:glycosyltransferase n=1 Tax=Gordonia TaxID=2053 RepID=UPI0032B3E422